MPGSNGISTGSNIFQPGAISIPQANRQLMSDLQILNRHFYKYFINKYPNQMFTNWLATFAGMEETKGQEFYHYESLGKRMLHVVNKTAVAAPAAGATVTVVIQVADHYNAGTQSAIRVGETVKTASSGIEGKVLTIDKTTANAHSMTIRPLRADQAFVSAGSANLLANEVLKLMSNTEAGEASSNIDPQIPVNEKITNYCTTIRDDWKATDHAEMEEVEYIIQGTGGDISAGIKQDGQSAFTYRGLTEANLRYLTNIDLKLQFGGLQTNTGLNASDRGTKGLVPEIQARGNSVGYTIGSLDIGLIQAITAQMDVYGNPIQNQWLMDIRQRQEFDNALFALYPAGAFVWGNGAASEQASVSYGFKQISVDNYVLSVGKNMAFNTEVLYGVTPDVDQYRNFGIIVPQGSKSVRGNNGNGEGFTKMDNLTIMFEAPRGGGTIQNGIKVWEYGGAANENMTGTMNHTVSMITYRGLRLSQASQFFTVSGS